MFKNPVTTFMNQGLLTRTKLSAFAQSYHISYRQNNPEKTTKDRNQPQSDENETQRKKLPHPHFVRPSIWNVLTL